MYDIIIKNGTIIDGRGNPKFAGDIGIKDGVIERIGHLHNEKAQKEIDASGKYVSPGFIDVGNHSDVYWRLFFDPELESLLYQGITTIIGGNCGSSLAPLANKEAIKSIQKWVDIKKISFNWLEIGDFLSEVEKKGMSLNFGTLVGHSTLRRGLIGDEVRDLTPAEMKIMKKMLSIAMKQGALGFSSGLIYSHAKLASSREITELAEIAHKYGGVYSTHLRGEGEDLIKSIEEAIRVTKASGVSLEISHLKAMGSKNWKYMGDAINLIETARNNGLDVNFDVYPYTETGTVLYTILPSWVTEGGREMMLARIKNQKTRERIVKELKESDFDYSKILVSVSPIDKSLNRKRIYDMAKAQNKSMEDVILDLLIAGEGQMVTMMEVLSEKNVNKGIINPFSLISSNGAGYDSGYGLSSGALVHPRNFGSFPRVLGKYVKERKLISWEEAIRKMTSLPARKFKIEKRGELTQGNYADIVIFDPENIMDLATSENPYQYAQGIDWLLINGKTAIENGAYNKSRNGQVVRRKHSFFEF